MKTILTIILSSLILVFYSNNTFAQQKSGRLINTSIPASSLNNSLFKTSDTQPAAIYLPQSYDNSQRHFPVVYFLPGFNCPIHYFTLYGVFQGFVLKHSLDSLINSGIIMEMIVVVPNGLNF